MSNLPVDTQLIEYPLSYHSSQFVNREKELGIIATNVRLIQSGGVAREPLVNFWGVSGTGKTWLLLHLHSLYAYDRLGDSGRTHSRATFTLLYSFSEEYVNPALNSVVQCLATETLRQLSEALTLEEQNVFQRISTSGQTEAFTSTLRKLSLRFVPLILLDNAEKVPAETWEEIERFLIEPLISTGHILVVVAGRRQIPRWRRFEVRRRVMDTQKSRIHPFSKEDVLKQVASRHYRLPVNLLYPYTAGNPHLVEAIARNFETWADINEQAQYDQAWLDSHHSSLLAILRPSKERLLEYVSPALRQVLEAISPLRFYRLEALRYMLVAQDQASATDPDGYFLGLVRELDAKTEVAWWDREHRAYITSEDVRQIMNRVQLLADPSLYTTRHQLALQMYRKWAEEYPPASEEFVLEIWFHSASLYLADRNLERTRAEIVNALAFAGELNSDRLMVLQKQFEADTELAELLPDPLQEELTMRVGELLEVE